MTNLQTILMSGYAITLILVGLTAIRELVTIKRILSGLESKTNAPRPQESLGTAFEERTGIGYEYKTVRFPEGFGKTGLRDFQLDALEQVVQDARHHRSFFE